MTSLSPGSSPARSLRFPFALAVTLASAWGGVRVAAAAEIENPNPLRSAAYLAAGELAGTEFKVAPEATTDGFTNTYTVTSRFGSWPAHGRMQVAMRAREIQALAQLEEVSKTDVFKDAVKSSATAPLELVQAVVDKPVETLKGIPSGVGRWMKKTSFQVKEGYQDAKELRSGGAAESDGTAAKPDVTDKAKEEAVKYGLNYLKISGAELAWYAKLGVDPYTDNEVLRKAVTSVARVQGLTSFGMKFAGLPSIPGAREARKTMDLVWKTDPTELRMANRKKLLAAGLSEETARKFEDNSALSPSAQTALIQSLDELAGVAGRATLIARAIEVESRAEATTLVSAVALLQRFHRQQGALREFVDGTRLPVARTAKGALVAAVLTDALFWTTETAAAVKSFAAVYAGDPAKERQVWIVGEASAAFKGGAGALGWEVHDRWQSAAPEDVSPPAAAGAAR